MESSIVRIGFNLSGSRWRDIGCTCDTINDLWSNVIGGNQHLKLFRWINEQFSLGRKVHMFNLQFEPNYTLWVPRRIKGGRRRMMIVRVHCKRTRFLVTCHSQRNRQENPLNKPLNRKTYGFWSFHIALEGFFYPPLSLYGHGDEPHGRYTYWGKCLSDLD